MRGPHFIQPQATGLSGSEEAIDNNVKDNRNWLQACVSASGGNFGHVM